MEPGNDGVSAGADGILRCSWCGEDPLYRSYHDREWGRPVADDRLIFEKLCLEGFQSGLSWITILRKRESFRQAFAGFDIEAVARFDAADVERLLQDAGIVRNRAKILATINNAQRYPALVAEFGSLAAYLWSFEPEGAAPPGAESAEARAMSRELKKRGWSFLGPTTLFSAMQSLGVVNDHMSACGFRAEVEDERAGFVRP